MTALLLDQRLPRSAASILRAADWEVVHVGEIGFSHATDHQILAVARSQSRVCVTLAADFHAMLAATRATGPSVVRIRIEGLRAEQVAALLTTLWPRFAVDIEAGAAVPITAQSVLMRRLLIGGGESREDQTRNVS